MKDSAGKAASRYGLIQINIHVEFGKSTMAKTSSTTQIVFDDSNLKFDEMTEELVREKAEQFVLDLIAGKLFR
jgi:hypothetical protein